MGERATADRPDWRVRIMSQENCYYEAFTAILFGLTVVGEWCWDIRRAINALSVFPMCDLDKILITRNSGGGTTAYYAAAYDRRI